MRYLVTGGAGFIGSNTVDELVRRGHRVTVLDDLSAGSEQNLAAVRSQIELVVDTITDRKALDHACHGADYVLHLAARTSVPRSVQDPAETNRINVDGTLNVFLAARDARVRRVVFSSSSSVYGETPTLPKREDMAPAPISPYGVSKLVGELYGQVFRRVYGIEFVALRYFNVFGPRQNPGSPYSGVLSLFASAMRDGSAPTVYGDGEQSRDFTFVQNVAEVNIQACETPGVSGMIFNVGTGGRHTLNQTLRLFEKFSGRPANAKYVEPRKGDIRDSQADVALARQKLAYDPRVAFEEGLRRTWDWYCSAH
jgi:UDP-N-acetylglucosamine/UDP-N-acetyl-alpha-D-glucosaminouronate 4-epimerase